MTTPSSESPTAHSFSKSTPFVAVIIVNYGTAELTCRALDSLAREREHLPKINVVVVDNCSPDNSFDVISSKIQNSQYQEWASAVLAGKNGGYAYGNNLGFSYFLTSEDKQPDYFWLLNPDTYLRENAGAALLSFVETKGDVIAGSRLEDDDGTPQVSTFNFPSWQSDSLDGFSLGVLDRMFKSWRTTRDIVDQPEKVDWVAGASLLIPMNIFNNIGPMDDDYFLYYEEVDYCLQIQRAGYDCWYVPQSRVVHEVGAATGISDVRKMQPRRPSYWFESRERFFRKNFGILHLLMADLGWMIGYCVWLARKFFTDRADIKRQPPRLLRDFLQHSILNPFRSRRKQC